MSNYNWFSNTVKILVSLVLFCWTASAPYSGPRDTVVLLAALVLAIYATVEVWVIAFRRDMDVPDHEPEQPVAHKPAQPPTVATTTTMKRSLDKVDIANSLDLP